MLAWRCVVLLLVLAVVGLPLAPPLVQSLPQLAWLTDAEQLSGLAGVTVTTVVLVAGTIGLSIPLATVLAVLLFRTNLLWQGPVLFLLGLNLFIPLAVFTSAWQATLGPGTWLPVILWQPRPGQPWAGGLWPAIWVHALAGLPWAVFLIGIGLRHGQRELEEQALLSAPAWRVVWSVALPRARPAFIAAAVWLSVQVAGEVSVTDMFQVRTLAEDVYLTFTLEGQGALPRSFARAVPPALLLTLLLGLAIRHLNFAAPATRRPFAAPRRFALGKWHAPALGFVGLVVFFLIVVPLASLVWRGGLTGSPLHWSGPRLCEGLWTTIAVDSTTFAWSFYYSLVVAMLATGLALLIAWCLRWPQPELSSAGRLVSFLFRSVMLLLMAAALATPGPVLGLGLKQIIRLAIDWFPNPWLEYALYYGPSPVPLIWVQIVRFLPFTLAIVWVGMWLLPEELLTAARLDGARAWTVLRRIIVPSMVLTLAWSVVVTAALALGEVAASKLATTPGIETFTTVVFDRMHYGVAADVAALCLALVAVLVLFGAECAARARALGLMSRMR